MLKTLDVVIGATTVLLLFSMAAMVLTQAVTSVGRRRGRRLRSGPADLLQQLGIPAGELTKHIADTLLRHPLIAEGKGSLGTVIHREEFTKLVRLSTSAQAELCGFAHTNHGAESSLHRSAGLVWQKTGTGEFEGIKGSLEVSNDAFNDLRSRATR